MIEILGLDDVVGRNDPDGLIKHLSRGCPQEYELIFQPVTQPVRSLNSIPKMIHQIWLGSEIPPALRNFSNVWKRNHPGWEYHLWDDQSISSLTLQTEKIFRRATNWGIKSDLLRAEILHQFGGFYIDLDYQCYGTLDFLRPYDLVVTNRLLLSAHLGWPALYPSPSIICNSFIGAIPRHPALQRYLDAVRNVKMEHDKKIAISWLGQVALGGPKRVEKIRFTSEATYKPFHKVMIETLSTNSQNTLVLPYSFCNPILSDETLLRWMPPYWRLKLDPQVPKFRLKNYSFRRNYSFAVHLSRQSWL